MPAATATKTTWVSGRNVPVPRSRTVNGGCRRATAARCRSIAGRSAAATSVGPRRVTCAGTCAATGSPAATRAAVSSLPHGSGRSIATPMVVRNAAATSVRSTRSEEPDPVVDRAEGGTGDRAGLLGTDREQLVQLRRVLQVGVGALLDRAQELCHDLGEVLLE